MYAHSISAPSAYFGPNVRPRPNQGMTFCREVLRRPFDACQIHPSIVNPHNPRLCAPSHRAPLYISPQRFRPRQLRCEGLHALWRGAGGSCSSSCVCPLGWAPLAWIWNWRTALRWGRRRRERRRGCWLGRALRLRRCECQRRRLGARESDRAVSRTVVRTWATRSKSKLGVRSMVSWALRRGSGMTARVRGGGFWMTGTASVHVSRRSGGCSTLWGSGRLLRREMWSDRVEPKCHSMKQSVRMWGRSDVKGLFASAARGLVFSRRDAWCNLFHVRMATYEWVVVLDWIGWIFSLSSSSSWIANHKLWLNKPINTRSPGLSGQGTCHKYSIKSQPRRWRQ